MLTALNEQRDLPLVLMDQLPQLADALDVGTIDGEQDVALMDARSRGRPFGLLDHETVRQTRSIELRGRHRPHGEPEMTRGRSRRRGLDAAAARANGHADADRLAIAPDLKRR